MTENKAGEKPRHGSRLASLAAAVGATKTRGPAPVELWHPPYCGEIDLRIAADGTWFYEGSPIDRPALVSLFAGILRKDSERYVLVTPVECVGISVDDAPFVGVACERSDDTLHIVTNLGDETTIGADHPLRFETEPTGGLKPYAHVRGDLWARLSRSLAIELIAQAVTEAVDGVETLGIRSGGRFFPIAPAEAAA